MHLAVHHIIKININKWKSEKLIPMIDINQQLNILLESFTSKLVSKSTLFEEKNVLVESRKMRQRSRKEQRNIPVGVNCEWIVAEIKNCKLMPDQELQVKKKRQRIKKKESERRRFVKRNKNLTLFADLKQWSRVFCSSALHDWNCFSLIRFYLCLQLQQLCIVHLRRLTSLYIKKGGRVSAGFTRVARVPGRPGFTGPTLKQVFA